MAVSIIAWNMQGERNTGYNDAYPLVFGKILPLLFNAYPNDYWLIYLCEAGNPFMVSTSQVTPGAVALYFNSDPTGKEYAIPWGLPKNFAARGIYSPWQQPDKQGNLRCSVMIMEVVKYGCDDFPKYPRFQFSYDFLKSNSQLGNIRPIVYAVKQAGSTNDFSIAGVHNVANQTSAVAPTNAIAKSFSGGTRGACIVGDMNIAAPIKSSDTWPAGLELGSYQALLAGAATQLGGNQLDWAFQNMAESKSATAAVVRSLSVIPSFKDGEYSGIISSDHEVLYYRLDF
ncbi:MAG TPA: hypothetical protein VF727_04720 [Allosphingosinicella sp.]|jgi:hypothetical protein